ncbi:MAG: thermonuclease family protein [Pseudomonadota bacterium]
MSYTLSMLRIGSLALFYAVAALVARAETLPGPIPADVLRVIDGDTVKVRAHIWVNQSVEVSVRLAGVDTPEISRPACRAERVKADAAKDAVEALVGEELFLTDVTLGKYAGRVVANIATTDGTDLGEHLLETGQAVRDGERDPWCDAPPTPSAEIAATAPAP